jgi:sugar/nucleoside kinase (ribokinase family)
MAKGNYRWKPFLSARPILTLPSLRTAFRPATTRDVARDYAISFGGNAVTAAFCCAHLGVPPDLLTSLADDWLGRMFLDMAAKYQVSVHPRKVKRSSLSFVMPKGHQARHPALARRQISPPVHDR